MNRILESLGWMGRYLWAGWAGLSGIFCFLAAWQAGHEIYGSFILPSPGETFTAIGVLAARPDFFAILSQTVTKRSISRAGCTCLSHRRPINE